MLVFANINEIFQKYKSQIDSAATAFGVYRNGNDLQNAIDILNGILENPELVHDTDTKLRATSVWLMLRAALKRTESRGTQNRIDYPDADEKQLYSNIFLKDIIF